MNKIFWCPPYWPLEECTISILVLSCVLGERMKRRGPCSQEIDTVGKKPQSNLAQGWKGRSGVLGEEWERCYITGKRKWGLVGGITQELGLAAGRERISEGGRGDEAGIRESADAQRQQTTDPGWPRKTTIWSPGGVEAHPRMCRCIEWGPQMAGQGTGFK